MFMRELKATERTVSDSNLKIIESMLPMKNPTLR